MKQQDAWRTPQKYRDQLLSAAMTLAKDPTKTLRYLAEVDRVLAEVQKKGSR